MSLAFLLTPHFSFETKAHLQAYMFSLCYVLRWNSKNKYINKQISPKKNLVFPKALELTLKIRLTITYRNPPASVS